jgi:hypothetical protein
MVKRGLLPILLLALTFAGLHTPAATAQVGTVQPGSAAIWTDKSEYNIGDSIQYCFRIPFTGLVTITDLPPNGTSNVIFNQVVSVTHSCMNGVVTPPSGHECLRMNYPLAGGQGTTQACFTVLGSIPPPGGLAIYTNANSYLVGSSISVCYRVPAPGPIVITDTLANGQAHTFFSGYDDGTGGCIPGVITPPTGTECMSISFTYPNGVPIQNQTCFQVNPRLF